MCRPHDYNKRHGFGNHYIVLCILSVFHAYCAYHVGLHHSFLHKINAESDKHLYASVLNALH